MAGVDKMLARVRPLASKLSPRARRYRAFLRSLPFEPASLSSVLEAPGRNDFVMCGCPRTGTSLLSAALFQPPASVTVMEPWDGMRIAPAPLFSSLRAEVARGVLKRGRLDHECLVAEGAVRWTAEGAAPWRLRVNPDHLLGVKWTGWWQLIDLLPTTPFLVCLRDPAEVIASMRDAGGRVQQGLQYDTPFNRELNESLLAATADHSIRRIMLFDYIHERLAPLLDRDNVLVVRYERWTTDKHQLLRDISEFLGRDLSKVLVHVRPHQALRMDERELSLVRTHCKTADLLGYELG